MRNHFLAALVIGGGLSWVASSHLDGLEWAMLKASGKAEPEVQERGIHGVLAEVQEKTALLPDYNFPAARTSAGSADHADSVVDAGTSVAGIVGGLVTLLIAGLIGWLLRTRQNKKLT